LEEMLNLVPNSALGRSLLANIYVRQGEWERAIEVRKRQIQADPSYMLGYGGLINDYTDLDRFADAHAVADLPVPKQANAPNVQMVLLRLAYVEGDLTEAERIWEETQRSDPAQGAAVKLRYMLSLGRFAEASQLVKLIRDLGDRSGSRSAWTTAIASLQMARALAGDCGFLKETGDSMVSAETLLYCGEHVRAARQAEELVVRPGTSTDAIAQARAVAALAKRQPQQAIDALEPLRRLDNTTTNPLLRGMAYTELKRHVEAATEFRRLTARQSQMLDTGYAAAHVYRARALVAAGDKAEAKKSYDAFLALWKSSDAGVPLLVDARREHAELR
jgi:tetratricopeptide (TPR) repeat protein